MEGESSLRVKDLHVLPKFRDGWSYLYVEQCKIDKDAKAIALHDAEGKVPIPCANLAVLMLGPGVSITHAAISVLSDHGCLIVWCGEQGVRYYAVGMGETRSAANILHQMKMWASEELRMKVVRNLYQMRFSEELEPNLTLRQIRGKEGARVRDNYAKASLEWGVQWKGRIYNQNNWSDTDPVNRALSTANACLYGICHAAVVSAGFSSAVGFIHTGKMLSFVYDIADLYKTQVSIPAAFRAVADGQSGNLDRLVRLACRDMFAESRLLSRVVADIQNVLMMPRSGAGIQEAVDSNASIPGPLWDPVDGRVKGGLLYAQEYNGTGEEDAGNNP